MSSRQSNPVFTCRLIFTKNAINIFQCAGDIIYTNKDQYCVEFASIKSFLEATTPEAVFKILVHYLEELSFFGGLCEFLANNLKGKLPKTVIPNECMKFNSDDGGIRVNTEFHGGGVAGFGEYRYGMDPFFAEHFKSAIMGKNKSVGWRSLLGMKESMVKKYKRIEDNPHLTRGEVCDALTVGFITAFPLYKADAPKVVCTIIDEVLTLRQSGVEGYENTIIN